MLSILLLSFFLKSSLCSPVANYWLSPMGSVPPLRQYHMQDGSGSYQYAFTGPHHAKAESSLNGITQGGYSYIDANGVLQSVAYTADDLNGFRVSASNLPQPPKNELQDSADENAAKTDRQDELRRSQLSNHPEWQDHNILSYKFLPPVLGYTQLRGDATNKPGEHFYGAQTHQNTKNPFLLSRAEAAKIEVPKPDPSLSKASPTSLPTQSSTAQSGPLSKTAGYKDVEQSADSGNGLHLGKLVSIPDVHRPHPVPASYVLPVLPYRLLHSSLHHTQDSLGQYDYSYTGDTSAKTESRSLDGTTRGAYSYIDPNGILQQVHYVADHNGFRVLATNLPEA